MTFKKLAIALAIVFMSSLSPIAPVARRIAGAEVGTLLGWMSTRVLGQYDLLLVEDDRMIGESLRAALKMEGHAVDWVTDAQLASTTLATERFDLALLDLGLPKGNGVDVLRELRARGDATPVIVLTAKILSESEYAELRTMTQRVVAKGQGAHLELTRVVRSVLEPA